MTKSKKTYSYFTLFHRRQSGQSMVMISIILLTLVCFFAFTINVGHRINNKIEMQNTIDSATYSAAVWNARGMNIIAILNVGMAECLALIILINAYNKTVDFLLDPVLVSTNLGAAATCITTMAIPLPLISAACVKWQLALNFFVEGEALHKLYTGISETLEKALPPLWGTMDQLNNIEGFVKWSFPVVGLTRASEIAKNKGAGNIIGEDNPLGFGVHALVFPMNPLPLEEGDFKEICDRTIGGGLNEKWLGMSRTLDMELSLDFILKTINDHAAFKTIESILSILETLGIGGKNIKQGPKLRTILGLSLVPMQVILPGPIAMWPYYYNKVSDTLCEESTNTSEPSEVPENNAKTWEECREKGGKQDWLDGDEILLEKEQIDLDEGLKDCNPKGHLDNPPSQYSSKDWYMIQPLPPGLTMCKTREKKVTKKCSCSDDPECVCKVDENGNTLPGEKVITEYYRHVAVLKSCLYKEEIAMNKNEFIPPKYQGDKIPKPYVLAPDWANGLQFSGFLYKNVGDAFPVGEYLSAGEENNYLVARASVYNKSNPDMFNQDWNTTLSAFDIAHINFDVLNFGNLLSDFSGDTINLPDEIKIPLEGIRDSVEVIITH